ncbi:MAG: hypothetical protein H6672_13380 [Anaerolineaceae bacterium]|nr:hypothetical protein [Anaerolineaceae bacterium]
MQAATKRIGNEAAVSDTRTASRSTRKSVAIWSAMALLCVVEQAAVMIHSAWWWSRIVLRLIEIWEMLGRPGCGRYLCTDCTAQHQ